MGSLAQQLWWLWVDREISCETVQPRLFRLLPSFTFEREVFVGSAWSRKAAWPLLGWGGPGLHLPQ